MHHCVVWFSHIPLRDSSGFSPDSLVFLLYEKGNAIRGEEELIASSIVKGDVRRCTWWRESFMKWGKFLEPRVVTVVVQLQWRGWLLRTPRHELQIVAVGKRLWTPCRWAIRFCANVSPPHIRRQ